MAKAHKLMGPQSKAGAVMPQAAQAIESCKCACQLAGPALTLTVAKASCIGGPVAAMAGGPTEGRIAAGRLPGNPVPGL